MSLARFSVNQSLFVNLLSVIIVIVGGFTLMGMNREVFPNVEFDIVSVTAAYPGATPADVEKLITTPIEKELREVDGIKEISSTSAANISSIYVKIEPDEDNKQKVIRDIQNAVDKVSGLPDDVEDPEVVEITSKQYPIIEVSLSGAMPEASLRAHADTLEDVLEEIRGVARVRKSGYREREIQILLDPEKMRTYYVSIDEIERALASRNVSMPAGKISTDTSEFSIRTTGEFASADDILDVIIRANDSGNWLAIRDIAAVADDFKDEDVINKTRGTRSVNLVVLKKESGDAISIVSDIKKRCDEYQKSGAGGLEIAYVNDYSYYAKRRLNVLTSNAWGSVIIVMGMLLIFLEKRVAFFTFLGIPIAFCVTFIVMSQMGITINLISMFGLIIVLGMLVDDGIIVAENVYRYMEEGMPPREAAVKGTEEVLGSVCAAVFTTVASFLPLLMMTGIIGKFIRDIPMVVIVALLASLAEAFIVLPSHLADFVKIKLNKNGRAIGSTRELPWYRTLVFRYTVFLRSAMNRPYVVSFILVVVFILTIFAAATKIKFVLFPSSGINYFFIRAETPVGTPLEKTRDLLLPIEELVSKLPKEELDTYVTTVGQIQEDRNDPFTGIGSNVAQISVYLTQEQDRKRKVEAIIEDLRAGVKDLKGFTDLRFDKPQTGPPVGKPVEVKIRGEHFNVLDTIAKEYMDHLNTIDGTSDVTWDNKPGKEEIRVDIDMKKAALAGLNVGQIARTVRAVFSGGIATKIKPVKAEEETDVTVRFDKSEASKLSVFGEVTVSNSEGKLIPLSKVSTIERVSGSTPIHHLEGKRVVTVSCNVDTDKVTSVKINADLAKRFSDIGKRYRGYFVKYGGEQEESIESLKSLLKAFFVAFLIVYLILAYTFKSLLQPFIVMLAIPFGIIGVVVAFILHSQPFSFMAIMGIVGLNGIVVNDSIVLVDFINKFRAEGRAPRAAIVKACRMRIRPVILTTVTTVGGLVTVAYGIGGSDPFLVPMALAISWGLLFSTVLTLIVIPCIYVILESWTKKFTRRTIRVDPEMAV
ncbi:MAG: efflux RND transporter permease subunit [Candidatus Omnitrophica bacterium]|nr:efflux RND transporter permease subunit [Candidatus Omnitrophota bacterium]